MSPGITAARAGVASNDAFLASYVARVVTISSTRTERCCRSSRLPTFEQDGAESAPSCSKVDGRSGRPFLEAPAVVWQQWPPPETGTTKAPAFGSDLGL